MLDFGTMAKENKVRDSLFGNPYKLADAQIDPGAILVQFSDQRAKDVVSHPVHGCEREKGGCICKSAGTFLRPAKH